MTIDATLLSGVLPGIDALAAAGRQGVQGLPRAGVVMIV